MGDGPAASPRAEYMPRARVAGGCTMHNYVIFLRGSPTIYDAWGDGWSWADLLPTFKAIERDVRPNATAGYHGDAGECFVEGLGEWSPKSATAFVDAGVKAGHSRNLDFNGAALEGVGEWPTSTHRGKRWPSSRAFLSPQVCIA